MRFGAVLQFAPLLVAGWASASDTSPPADISHPAGLHTTTRQLTGNARVVTDNLGGWRLERYSDGGHLLQAEDSYGVLVEVIRVAGGRPIGLILAGRYALEYLPGGSDSGGMTRVIYDPADGSVLSETGTADLVPGPLAKAARPAEPVVRQLEIADPDTATTLERIAYTDSELLLEVGDDSFDLTRTIVIPRSDADPSPGPKVVAAADSEVARYQVVRSRAGYGRQAPVSRPKLKGVLPSAVEDTLLAAHPLALRRVREVTSCRALFEELVVSGNQRLSDTLYAPPSGARTADSCDRGALAYTHVGSPVTHLCSGFGGLTTDEAAIVLIHEALHFAGLEEAPFYEGALTSAEINSMVYSACGFESPATAAAPSP